MTPPYTLVRPRPGEFLYEDGKLLVLADDAEQAKDCFDREYGERPEFVHSLIAHGRLVYARDIETGDCHEGAAAGDTTFSFSRDNGRKLARGEFRVWERGPLRPGWVIKPIGLKGDGFTVVVGGQKVGEAKTYPSADRLRQQAEKKCIEAWEKEQREAGR